MLWEVVVEGSYRGLGGKEPIPFEFKKEISYCHELWLDGVIQSRLLPIWIEEARKTPAGAKKYPQPLVQDNLISCMIYEYTAIDKPDPIVGKNIMEMDFKEIQECASRYRLILVPKAKRSIEQLRTKCVLEYLDIVKGIYNSDKEIAKKNKVKFKVDKSKYAFYKRTPSGEYVASFRGEQIITEDINVVEVGEAVVKAKPQTSISDIMGNAKSVSSKIVEDEITEEDLLANL